jgi:hypothetical protein
MTNGDNGNEFFEPFWEAVNTVYGWKAQTTDTEAKINSAIVGEYRIDDINVTVRVVKQGDDFNLQMSEQVPLLLKAKSDKEIQISGLGTTISLEVVDNQVIALNFQQGVIKHTAKRAN